MNKFGDAKTDYDMIIVHQMETRVKMLAELADKGKQKE
jgi:hypothetical protein